MKPGPLRARQEIVAPQHRNHQHVGLADPLLERGAVTHLEALDGGRERQEALTQPIGNMRKANASAKRCNASCWASIPRPERPCLAVETRM
jgi:hypothetical protein